MERLDSTTVDRALRNHIYSLERKIRYVSGVDSVDIRYYSAGYGSITLRMRVKLYENASRRWAESDIKNAVVSYFNSEILDELSREYDVSSWRYPNVYLDIDFEGGQ